MLTFGSLFAGIGGFDVGFTQAGMRCLWRAEIDQKCNTLLDERMPGIPNLGDVRNVTKENAATPDVICGGFPCQDLSVAGKRKGLAGSRSGLWFEFHRVLAELRPQWAVIENVPGLLSSNGGRDFAVILRGLAQIGYLTAWRVLDLQYYGMAQRRRRVFIVASLGDGRAAEVLFERQSLSWDSAPSRETGEGAAGTFTIRTGKPGGGKGYLGLEGGAMALSGQPQYVTFQNTGHGWWNESPVGQTLRTPNGGGSLEANVVAYGFSQESDGSTARNAQDIARPITVPPGDPGVIAYTIQTNDGGNHKRKDRPAGGMYVKEVESALTVGSSDQTIVMEIHGGSKRKDRPSGGFYVREMPTTKPLDTGGLNPNCAQGGVVAFQSKASHTNSMNPSTISPSIDVGKSDGLATIGHYGVRRLTPTECERLQGFEDGHTDNGQSDSARYRQLGNAVGVRHALWIGRGIVAAESEQ